jgi:hypothetical protein
MNERDLVSKQTTHKNILRIAHLRKYVVDEASPRMRPPVPADWFTEDCLDETWCIAFRRGQHDAMLTHERQRGFRMEGMNGRFLEGKVDPGSCPG